MVERFCEEDVKRLILKYLTMKTQCRNFLPHEIEYQFGFRNRNTNHRRSINIERFWNDRHIGKLTTHKNDVFCLEDECDAYAYAVQFCPQKVTLRNPDISQPVVISDFSGI